MMTREETFSLLVPRYLRGELSPEQTVEFEAYLSENPDFQADIEFQRNLMTAREDAPEAPAQEFGWARLSRSIDNLETQTSEVSTSEAKPKSASMFGGMWKVAAIALACVSIGQAFYITNYDAPKQYQLASEKEAPGVSLQLSFKASVSFTQLSDLLAQHNSQIISGPSTLGIYTLSFADKEDCLSMISALTSKESLVDTYTSCAANSQSQ
ncbi:MAG: hypothetical protein ABJ275_12700 [Maricaulaceae bacterium]